MIPKFVTELETRMRYRNYKKISIKFVEWANKWHINLNVDKYSVMHIGHSNMQGNYNMSNQQLPTTDQQWDLGIGINKNLSVKNKERRAAKL